MSGQDPTHRELEELATSTEWLRGLARSLVGEVGEDLAQDAWVAALSRDGTAAPRASWLGGVVHNLARSERRDAARRVARERRGAKAERLPSAEESVLRFEEQRRLVEAVYALGPTLRGAVVLRYFEGLPPREIARREAVPVSTVKTRLKRALTTLRERLVEAHGGDERRFLAALVPLLAEPQRGSWTIGTLLMKKSTLVLVGSLAVLFGAWSVASLVAETPDEPGTEPVVEALVHPSATEHSLDPVAPEAESQRVAVASDPVADASPSVEPETVRFLRVRVTRNGRTVQGARVEALSLADAARGDDGSIGRPRSTRLDRFELGHDAPRTDAEGIAVLRLRAAHDAVVALDGGAWGQGFVAKAVGELEVQLHGELGVDVLVVDAAGRPRAGVAVELGMTPFGNPRRFSTSSAVSDEDGRARLWYSQVYDRAVQQLEVFAVAHRAANRVVVDRSRWPEAPVELVVDDAGALVLRILDALDEPVANEVPVSLSDEPDRVAERAGALYARTKGGEVRFEGVPVNTTLHVAVGVPGAEAGAELLEVAGPTRDGETALRVLRPSVRRLEVTGRIVEADGTVWRKRSVYFGVDAGPRFANGLQSAPTDENGRFEVVVANPAQAVRDAKLRLTGPALVGKPPELRVPLPSGDLERWDAGDLAWPDVPRISGVVLGADGEPRARVQIGLVRLHDDGEIERLAPPHFALTDSEGRFALRGELTEPPFWIHAPDSGAEVHDPVELHGPRQDLVLQLRRAAALRGWIAADGRPLDGIAVRAWPLALGEVPPLSDRRWESATASEAGAFEVGPIPPGRYLVRVFAGSAELIEPLEVTASADGERDPLLDPIDLTGRVQLVPLHAYDDDGAVRPASYVFDEANAAMTFLGRASSPQILVLPAGARGRVAITAHGHLPAVFDLPLAGDDPLDAYLPRGRTLELVVESTLLRPGLDVLLRLEPIDGAARRELPAFLHRYGASFASVDEHGVARVDVFGTGPHRLHLRGRVAHARVGSVVAEDDLETVTVVNGVERAVVDIAAAVERVCVALERQLESRGEEPPWR